MNLLDIKVKAPQKLKIDFADAFTTASKLGRRAAWLLEHRVNQLGFDADHNRLPQVTHGVRDVITSGKGSNQFQRKGNRHNKQYNTFYAVSAKDPRFKEIVSEFCRVQGGLLVNRRGGGYEAFKSDLGKATHRGSDLTGAMWKSLTVAVRRKSGRRGAWFEVRLYFAGGQRTRDGYLRNRDKARLAQYSHRADAKGHNPAGHPDFLIAQFSDQEMKEFAAYLADKIELFEPRRD